MNVIRRALTHAMIELINTQRHSARFDQPHYSLDAEQSFLGDMRFLYRWRRILLAWLERAHEIDVCRSRGIDSGQIRCSFRWASANEVDPRANTTIRE